MTDDILFTRRAALGTALAMTAAAAMLPGAATAAVPGD